MNRYKQFFVISACALLTLSPIFAQEENQESTPSQETSTSRPQSPWQAHFGIGMNIGVSGLPSQVSNKLAQKEGFLSDVGMMRGLPLGASFFTGFGYKFSGTDHSMGFEFGMGFHNDGGSARVTLGDDPANIPGYVFDGAVGALGVGADSMLDMALLTIPAVYKGLSTTNTMKGQYLDPKFRIYYRYNQETWNIQTGLGLGFLIPLNYFAYPSKFLEDYDSDTINAAWILEMTQGPITTARIPFPLVMRDGTVMMRAIQPLADLHVRASYKNYYFDVSYSTEFRFIHHVKLGMGIMFA